MCPFYFIEGKEEVTQQQSKKSPRVTALLTCEGRTSSDFSKKNKKIYIEWILRETIDHTQFRIPLMLSVFKFWKKLDNKKIGEYKVI